MRYQVINAPFWKKFCEAFSFFEEFYQRPMFSCGGAFLID
jgi:hypothetical protein